MKKSPNDKKHYQSLTLTNGLRVLLIHHPDSKKSAAALAVNVGHFSDPENRQGLAHFLEHMLFLGTKKYPDGSEYQQFISKNGGHHNAWTGTEHTCFFFDIPQTHFENALDRFSQFFISPLLSQAFINKERENIEAEFKLKLKDDIRRIYDVHKETVNPAHPFSKFSVGNTQTLSDDQATPIRNELIALYQNHYIAEKMTLVIEGPQSLESLGHFAKHYFSDIKSNNAQPDKQLPPLYLPEHLKKWINIKPVKNDKQLIISFALPAIDKYYRAKPEAMFAYLLGYEGKGSILSFLKKKQWAIALTAGSGVNGSNFKDFNINVFLTDEGESHCNEIIQVIFHYLALIAQTPNMNNFYLEKKAIADLSFLYQEKHSALDTVSQLVTNMQHYPEPDYIYGDYAMEGFNSEQFNELLSYFTCQNMRIIQIGKQANFERTSQWYQVPYSVANITNQQLDLWQSPIETTQLCLPTSNPYIVRAPKLVPRHSDNPEKLPQCLKKEAGLTVWFKQDQTFNVPKGYVYVGMDSPLTIESTDNIAMTRLFVDIYSDAVIEQHYDAELAGIHYHIYSHQGGLSLQMSGLSEHQGLLLAKLLQSLKSVTFDEEKFNLIKNQLLLHWANADKNKSISQLFSMLSSALQPKNPSSTLLYQALKPVSYQQFLAYSKKVSQEVSLEMLIHGNWQKQDAIKMSETVSGILDGNYHCDNRVNVPIVDISGEGEITIPLLISDHDHGGVIYFPITDKCPNTIAKTIITSQLLSPIFFQKMRTEKQYGYLVGVGYVPIQNFPGLAFYIQSPTVSSVELIAAMEGFIENYQTYLDEIPDAEWQYLKQGLASQLKEKDSSLKSRSQRFWGAISNNDLTFDHKEKVIAAILALTPLHIREFFEAQLLPSNNADRINLMTFADQNTLANHQFSGTVVEDISTLSTRFQQKTS